MENEWTEQITSGSSFEFLIDNLTRFWSRLCNSSRVKPNREKVFVSLIFSDEAPSWESTDWAMNGDASGTELVETVGTIIKFVFDEFLTLDDGIDSVEMLRCNWWASNKTSSISLRLAMISDSSSFSSKPTWLRRSVRANDSFKDTTDGWINEIEDDSGY